MVNRGSREIKSLFLSLIFHPDSLHGCGSPIIGRAVREHWAIENRLHWCLDVTYNDDASRIRKDHGPQNMTVLRRLSVNLLRQIELGPKKISLRGRLIMANHDPAFILRALGV